MANKKVNMFCLKTTKNPIPFCHYYLVSSHQIQNKSNMTSHLPLGLWTLSLLSLFPCREQIPVVIKKRNNIKYSIRHKPVIIVNVWLHPHLTWECTRSSVLRSQRELWHRVTQLGARVQSCSLVSAPLCVSLMDVDACARSLSHHTTHHHACVCLYYEPCRSPRRVTGHSVCSGPVPKTKRYSRSTPNLNQ